MSKSVYTNAGGAHKIDIVDSGFVALNPWIRIILDVGYPYNSVNMP